jgi:hypothetical protein
MKKLLLSCTLLLVIGNVARAQIGGKSSFEFLNNPLNARVAGIGGVNISLGDYDVNMVYSNPALLNSNMAGNLSISYAPLYAGINTTSLAYAHDFNKKGVWATNFTYLNYGTMQETDDAGNVIGEFGAADYQAGVSHARQIDNFSLGATLRVAGSVIESYTAHAVTLDAGAVFKHPDKEFSAGIVVRNIGYVFDRFTPDIRPNLPFNVQMGMSYKLEHMPLRFSLTAHHLQQLDIVYLDPDKKGIINANGEEVKPKKSLGDKVARHFVLGGEFVFSKNFNLRLGYNHLMRRELRLENRGGASGFSLGFMARVKSFELAYSRAWYHIAGGTNYLTITSNLNSLFNRAD